MLSNEMRCHYRHNQLAEVICQLRFPEILTIETALPAQFQDEIRSVFPRYLLRKEAAPDGKQSNNYQFMTADGNYRVNLTSKFISLACTSYDSWEAFASMLDKPLAAFIRLYQPAYFERVGLRYLNFFSREALDMQGVPFREMIQSHYLGILSSDAVSEAATTRCTVDVDTALRGGCRVKVHAGPGNVNRGGKRDPEIKFVLDIDLYMPGNVPVNTSAGALQTLHSQSYGVFRGAITDLLHDVMGPN